MNTEKKKGGIGRIVLRVFLVLLLLLAVGAGVLYVRFRKAYKEYTEEATQSMNTIVGKQSPDFSVPLTDGTTVTLSDLLADHEVVVLNVFATWCGPCEREFPEMEKVYEEYGDKAAFLAVSTDPLDTLEDIAAYKESHGLTFPMGYTADGLDFFVTTSYPTTFVIDRNGVVGFCQMGYFANGDLIEQVVTPFMGDDYEQTKVALYSLIVLTKEGTLVPGAELALQSDSVEEVLTTNENGEAFYITQNPEAIDITVLSLPGNYKAEEGTVATTSGTISTWTPIYVE